MVRKRGRRRRGRRGRRIGTGGLTLFLLAAVAAGSLSWLAYRGLVPVPSPPSSRTATAAAPPAPAAAPSTDGLERIAVASRRGDAAAPAATPAVLPAASPAPLPDVPPAPADGAYVAVVVDDLGRSLADLRTLAELGVPLTYAVLPFESLTRQVVAELHAEGAETLVHLPMEGRDGANPGPGALILGMSERELAAATRAALAAVPGAAGVNNHMGSVLSADASSMRVVLRELGGHGLYFLDSRTTADSVGYGAARAVGMPAARRDVFLDGEQEPRAIRRQFRRLLALAAENGSAIAIGHPHPQTLAVLAEEVPAARRLGYRFVAVSALLDRGTLPE